MSKAKYILIVSQYYYSHHCFIVSADEENYREKALTLIERLEDYKRDVNNKSAYSYGYHSREESYTDIDRRWNVNDTGDIYFIPFRTNAEAVQVAKAFAVESFQTENGYKKAPKKLQEKIKNDTAAHHDFARVSAIVWDIFEMR